MYQIFTERYKNIESVLSYPAFDLIRRTLQGSIKEIIDYLQNRVIPVKGNHLLAKLLTTTSLPLEYSDERFLEAMITRAPFIAKNFQFTSSINYGTTKQGVFYNKSSEIIIYTDEYFNLEQATQDWKNAQAVTVLTHPISDLSLALPDGSLNSSEEGLAVIAVNIPLLLLQYRGFLKHIALNYRYETNSIGVTHFLHMYVLPNMLYSHVELVIMNRLMNLFYGAPMGKGLKKYAISLPDYSDKLDKILLEVLERLQALNTSYNNMLMNIPSIYRKDMSRALIMPDLPPTRQVWWALLITRLPVIKFLLDSSSERALTYNRSEIAALKIDIKRLLQENVMQARLPKDLYYDITTSFNQILKL